MDTIQDCNSIKRAIAGYWSESLGVSAFDDFCIVTLPLRTLDGRTIDIFIEPTTDGRLTIHDAGKSSSELYAQGIHDTKRRLATFEAVARRYGASFIDDRFAITCRATSMHQAILNVAQCASLAMHDVATHKPVLDELSVKSFVGDALEQWKPSYVGVERDYEVRGATKRVRHKFDYAALTVGDGRRDVAVNILMPTYGPGIQSRKYGFLVLDLRNTSYANWGKLAVIGRREEWQREPLEIVRSLADETLELETGDHEKIQRQLPAIMSRLVGIAA